eukprot:15366564-Ditylum_brightwellii.AAC.2
MMYMIPTFNHYHRQHHRLVNPLFSEMQGAASGRYFVDSATGDIITDTDYNGINCTEGKGFLFFFVIISSLYPSVHWML